MLFNSLDYIIFFTLVTILFYLLPHYFRWMLLLAASYYFYMYWNVNYIILILFTTVSVYYLSLKIAESSDYRKKKKYLIASILLNFGLLFVFKYFNFFTYSLFSLFNASHLIPQIYVYLPVGISFYTFQSIGYTIDVYRCKIKPERNLGIFSLFVSFFPQLVAGPIERSDNLIPQFYKENRFDYQRLISGLKLILWGFFKKLVVADRLGLFVSKVYQFPDQYNWLALTMGTYFFAFQIYCDFSGYSDIAIGSARILGFDLMNNFDRPYYATSLRDFWRRWHISLTTWFRDYVYIPLGGNRRGVLRTSLNILIVFIVCGLWHGANWTFVVWGFVHAILLILSHITRNLRSSIVKLVHLDNFPFLHKMLKIFIVFQLTTFSWIFFRAKTISHTKLIFKKIFTLSEIGKNITYYGDYELTLAIISILVLELVQLLQGDDVDKDFLCSRSLSDLG